MDKKKIIKIVAIVVAVIAVLSMFGGGDEKKVLEKAEDYMERATACKVKDLEVEKKYNYPDSMFKEEELYIVTGKYKSGSSKGNYFICFVNRTSDGIEENISCSLEGEFETKKEFKASLDYIKDLL